MLGNVGEFVGSLGVLATLAYLSVQVRAAGQSSKFAAIQANRSERLEWFKAARDSPYIAAIYQKQENGEPLGEADQYRLEMHSAGMWALIFSDWVQSELGLAGEYATKEGITLHMALNRPAAMRWWDANGPRTYPPVFVEFVESRRAGKAVTT